jgi:hypothetical protein
MSGRRSEIRYRLAVPRAGELVISRNADIERTTDSEIFALADAPEARGQELTFEVPAVGASALLEVRVADCSPIVFDGGVRFRLRFEVKKGIPDVRPSNGGPFRADLLGVMAVSLPGRLIDVSRTGCLLETERHIAAGTIGEVRIAVNEQLLRDEIRVTWSNRVEGAGALCRVGAEFLKTLRPDGACLRRALQTVINARGQTRNLTTESLLP